nr:site-specific integrase [Pseudomonas viridiflava]
MSYLDVLQLVAACKEIGTSTFKRTRDRCLVTLMADTGIRREELTWIQCIEVKEAIKNGGRLKIRTSKRKGNPLREIPVPLATLELIDQFIDIQRALHMRRLKRRASGFADLGWVFCGYSGRKLAPVSLSQIFNDLRVQAGIKGRATPHMLRHRYITLQVMIRLQAVQHSNIGLEMITTILSQVASLTGHSNVESLWTYVDWAFEEIDALDDVIHLDYSKTHSVLTELMSAAENRGDKKVINALESCFLLLKKNSTEKPKLNIVSHSLRK